MDANRDGSNPEAKNESIAMAPNQQDWGNVPSKDCGHLGGQIGGKMVRDMIRIAEQKLADRQ